MAVAVLLVAACSSDPGTTSVEPGPSDAEPSSESSPFTVGPAPEGYRLVTAGTGTDEQFWGLDCCGSDEPYTVLSPDGTVDGGHVVVVALTGYADQQGELYQSSAGYPGDASADFTHEGRQAIFVPAGTLPSGKAGWADLVVAQDDTFAVRVTSPSATRDELLAIHDEVDASRGQTEPPRVDGPGLQVVGSADATAVLALRSGVQPHSDEVPGPPAAHSVAWGGPGDTELLVSTLPGQAVDVAAVGIDGWEPSLSGLETTVQRTDVDGRPAVIIDGTGDESDFRSRTAVVETDWGDVVVARSSGTSPTSEADMRALVETVEPTDQDTWDDLVIEATGGPGLKPDPGRTELARGEIDGLEWLLQDGSPSDGGPAAADPGPGVPPEVDTCLKLSNRSRSCTTGGGGSISDAVWFADRDEHLPDFAIIVTPVEAASVVVTTDSGEAGADLVSVPGSDIRTAVVFVEDPGIALCGDVAGLTVPETMSPMRVDVLDDDGEILGCLGGPGGLGRP